MAVGRDHVDREQVRVHAAELGAQAERDTGQRGGLTTDERQRLKELERDNRELRRGDLAEGVYFAQAALDRRVK